MARRRQYSWFTAQAATFGFSSARIGAPSTPSRFASALRAGVNPASGP
jgi:hypothetical protein